MTVSVLRKSKPVLRLAGRIALAGLPRNAAGRPVTVALVSRMAWLYAYMSAGIALVASARWGYSDFAGAATLLACTFGLVGTGVDRLKARFSQ